MTQIIAPTPHIANLLAHFLRLEGHVAMWLAECCTITTAPPQAIDNACNALYTTLATR